MVGPGISFYTTCPGLCWDLISFFKDKRQRDDTSEITRQFPAFGRLFLRGKLFSLHEGKSCFGEQEVYWEIWRLSLSALSISAQILYPFSLGFLLSWLSVRDLSELNWWNVYHYCLTVYNSSSDPDFGLSHFCHVATGNERFCQSYHGSLKFSFMFTVMFPKEEAYIKEK